MAFYIYILADAKNKKFVVSFTRNLAKQIHEMKHIQENTPLREQINKLVYFERHEDFNEAKTREKIIMDWDDDYMRQIISLQNGKFEDQYNKVLAMRNN